MNTHAHAQEESEASRGRSPVKPPAAPRGGRGGSRGAGPSASKEGSGAQAESSHGLPAPKGGGAARNDPPSDGMDNAEFEGGQSGDGVRLFCSLGACVRACVRADGRSFWVCVAVRIGGQQ